MAWKFHNNAPIYVQIMEEIKLRIAKGVLKPGDKVPPVRDLAINAGVNPNTMQKALSELEREGVLYSERTAGRFVSEINDGENKMREGISLRLMDAYVNGMRDLGYNEKEIISELEKYLNSIFEMEGK
ncbi:MAG: GntR family transcriptional regulator [Lachnospiraceae bacterium]|nr:GntR family transcriptional regulator [Lachnospiraceae bacterium]